MKSQHIPMPFEAFEAMPRPFGWKAEYWDGQAHLTPREVNVRARLLLTPRETGVSGCALKPLDPADPAPLIAAFFDAFRDSVELCDWPTQRVRSHAEENIRRYFQGGRGEPLPVSVRACEPGSGEVVGLALFVRNREGLAELDLLFVRPSCRRRGIATQMVSGAVNRLHREGVRELRSAYHICNEPSREWHHRFGFREIPDPFYCRLKHSWYRHEMARREKLGITEGLESLRRERDRWRAQLTEEEWD
jgi:GNAT superfamily N-acetyltransferase